MLHDELVEGPRIGQGAAHDLGVCHRLQPVGKGDGPAFRQEADLGELAAFQVPGHRGVGVDLHALRLAGAPRDELDPGDVVDHRVGVGQADHGGDAAGRRGAAGAVHGLLVLLAGLADLHAHVDQAGRQAGAAAVDPLRAFRDAVGEEAGPEIGDLAVLGEQAAGRIEAAGRVEQAGVDVGGAVLGRREAHWAACS